MEAALEHDYNQSGKHVRNIHSKRFKGENFQATTCVCKYIYKQLCECVCVYLFKIIFCHESRTRSGAYYKLYI